jgi:hypothetical protein
VLYQDGHIVTADSSGGERTMFRLPSRIGPSAIARVGRCNLFVEGNGGLWASSAGLGGPWTGVSPGLRFSNFTATYGNGVVATARGRLYRLENR